MRNLHSPIEYALFLLGIRDRSTGEITKKMKKRGFSEKEIRTTLTPLLKNNILNDERFARSYIKQRILVRPQGKYLLKQKLKEKFIDYDVIDTILDEISEEDEQNSADNVAKKWLKLHQKVPKEKINTKLGLHLAHRGFDYDKIKQILNKLSV